MLSVIGLLGCRYRVPETVDFKRRRIEDRIVGAVEDGAVWLVDVESSHHPAAQHQHGSPTASASRSSASWTAEATAFAWSDEDHVSASAALPLHALAHFLNAIFEFVRIHAKVLCLSHRAGNGNR